MKKSYFLFILLISFSCSTDFKEREQKKVFRYNDSSGLVTLDPAFAKDQSIIWPCTQLYNGLVQLDSHLIVRPSIAQSWEITDSGRVYIFHLRSDVYFHKHPLFPDSTRKVNAGDFVFSLGRLTDPKVLSPGAWVMNQVVKADDGNLTGVKAINDSTLSIELQKSYPPFLGLLSMPYCSVVPHEIVSLYGADFRSNPCGTGPFYMGLWKEGVKLTLLKNQNYFEYSDNRRLPFLDGVEISFISDKQSAFIEFLKGNLDFLSGLDVSFKDELLTRSGKLQEKYHSRFTMDTRPYLNTEYLGIYMDSTHLSVSPLRDKRIRQALNYGFNKNDMIGYLRNNMGTPGIYGIVPPGLPSFDSTAIVYDFQPDKARQLMADAGYPNGVNLPPIILSTTSTYQDLCEYIKSQWEELGFKVTIDVNQAAIHRKMIAEQKLSFFRASWIADYPDAENYLSLFYSPHFSPAGPNTTHFKNKEFDQLFELASQTTVDSIRYQYYSSMNKIMMDESPVIILYYDKVLRLFGNHVHGLGSNAMNQLVLKYVDIKK